MGQQLLAISIWNDDETKSLAKAIGADVLLDKSNLAVEFDPGNTKLSQQSKYRIISQIVRSWCIRLKLHFLPRDYATFYV